MVFDATGEKVIASRFMVQAYNVSDTQEDMRMMLDLRRICDESGLQCTVFHPLFSIFDQVGESALHSISEERDHECYLGIPRFISLKNCLPWEKC